jgi:type I restriction enzyme S subunit
VQNSGVTWLGEVPSRWQTVPLKRAYTRVKRVPNHDAGIVTAFRDGQVTLRANRRSDGYTEADDYSGYQGIVPGDLAIHSMDAFAGAIGVSDSQGMCSPVLSVCTPNDENDPRYMAYQLRLMSARGWIEALSRSVRERTSEFRWAEAGNQKIALPPVEEQRAIAEFLDRELGNIDILITKQLALIDALNTRTKSTIANAVLRGLSQNAKMMDTKVEWVGEIPQHWDLVRTRYLVDISTGSGDTVDAAEDGPFPFYVRSDTPLTSSTWEFDGDAVLTAGDGAGVGKVFHLVSGRFMAHQRVYVMNRFRRVQPKYFYYFFSALFASVALDGSAKSTVDSLRRPTIANMYCSVPPMAEQLEIISYLDRKAMEAGKLVAKADQVVSVLRERRAAIISAAVTGKIDVRGKN